MNKKALITGINGQDGAYLAQLLLDKDYEVHGLVRRGSTNKLWRLDYLGITNEVNLIELDLTEYNSVTKLIQVNQYNEIYNLAAQSFVKYSFDNPLYTHEVDTTAYLNILEAVRLFSPDTKVYQACTSEMFGLVQSTPQSESTPFYPRSPYGVAKVASYWYGVNYREAYNLHISNGILFNHESPLRGSEFVTQKIIEHVVRYRNDSTINPLRIGYMDAQRDWGYAKEYVEAMYLMTQLEKSDDFVISTGKTTSVRDFITKAFEAIGIGINFIGEGINEVGYSDTNLDEPLVIVDPQFYRPAEVDLLLGDNSKAFKMLNWRPKVSINELIDIMIDSQINLQNIKK